MAMGRACSTFLIQIYNMHVRQRNERPRPAQTPSNLRPALFFDGGEADIGLTFPRAKGGCDLRKVGVWANEGHFEFIIHKPGFDAVTTDSSNSF